MKVWVKVAPVVSGDEPNEASSAVTVCWSSSWLVQVTVVPGFTMTVVGPSTKTDKGLTTKVSFNGSLYDVTVMPDGAFLQNVNPLGGVERQRNVLLDEQHGHPFAMQYIDDFPDL